MKKILIVAVLLVSYSQTASAVWYNPMDWFGSDTETEEPRSKSSSSDDSSSSWYNPLSWFGSDSESEEPSYSSSSRSRWFKGYEIIAGAEMPYQFGGRFKVNINRDYYVMAGAGLNAEFLSAANEGVVTNIGQVATEDGVLVGQSMKGGVVFDLIAGMNLSSVKNVSIQAGYSYLAAAGGEVNGQDVFDAQLQFPVNIGGTGISDVQSTIHSLRFDVNYKWKLSKFSIYGTFGIIKPISVTTTASNILNTFQKDQFETYIDELITPLFIPTAAIWLSYPL